MERSQILGRHVLKPGKLLDDPQEGIVNRVFRILIVMQDTDGEIASKLCLTKTAVSTRISRGRRFLRNIVEQEGFLMDA